MKKLCLLFALCLAACGTHSDSDYKRFDFDLRGTWESSDESVYSGKLIIDFDKITITGYSENQTFYAEDDEKRPFKDFTKNTSLYGYSEDDITISVSSDREIKKEGIILIMDKAELKEGIPYTYYTTNSKQDRFLLFVFGEREEVLRFIE